MLNPDFNASALTTQYTQHGAALIHNILHKDVAQSLYNVFLDIPWTLEISGSNSDKVVQVPLPDSRFDPMNPIAMLSLLENDINPDEVFYVRMVQDQADFSHPLFLEFVEYVNSDEFINTMMILTGKNNLTRTSISATCYQRNCFLNTHSDDHDKTNIVALIFNLTPVWRLDWGGLLIISLPNNPPTIIPPTFNSLSLMNVPVEHFVSSVSPAATDLRYAMTGWLHDDKK